MAYFTVSSGRRLTGGFGLVLALCSALALVAWLQLRAIDAVVTDINDSWVVSIVQLNEINDAMSKIRRSELRSVVDTDPQHLAAEQALRAREMDRMKASSTPYEATGISGPPERKLYDQFRVDLQAYLQSWASLEPLLHGAAADRARAAAFVEGPSGASFERMQASLMAVVKFNVEGVRVARGQADDTLRAGALSILMALCVIIAVSAVFCRLVTLSIVRPLASAVAVARHIADGNLSQTVDVSRRDETGQLMTALSDMQTSLRSTLGDIQRSADQVGSASTQIATGNSDLSQRTERQASSLQQTASAVEELTSTVAQSTDSTRQANRLAMTATTLAQEGGAVVGEVIETMSGISQSSKRIGDIISVIDSIAFQTNILALNAAVEAARAGEQGRGFAVVATEVRTLAQRSAQAAKEIKTLIQDSVERVDSGGRLVQQAGGTMTDIVAAVSRVTELISAVATAATQQHGGIQSVNQAVAELDQGTQQNAALVEESAAAAASLRDQAMQLNAAVRRFRLVAA